MKDILREMYYLCEPKIMEECEEKLRKALTGEQWDIFFEYMWANLEYTAAISVENFKHGVKTGLKLKRKLREISDS